MKEFDTASRGGFARTLMFLALSFALAFCLQVAVHECGHLLAGMLAGAKGGRISLHPFYDSRVTFAREAGRMGQVLTGLAGPALDLFVALSLSLFVMRRKTPLVFPVLAWGGVALFGEGLGIVSSLVTFAGQEGANRYEDITQLYRVGAPPWSLWTLGLFLVIAGVWAMALIAPFAGLSKGESFGKRLSAFLAFLPLWFLASILWILVFNRGMGGLGMRVGQLFMSLPTALALALIYRPVQALALRGGFAFPLVVPAWRDLGLVLATAIMAFVGLLLA